MQIQPRNTVLTGDATKQLARLPAASIDCVITSPPFFRLRDYGTRGQIGLEASVEEWVASLRNVFAELARVINPGGAVWVDLADTYSQAARFGAPVKSLLLAPDRLLLQLVLDGWIIRNRVIWAKKSPMPSGVGDRLETTYDVLHLLVRSRRYFFDLDAIREPWPDGTESALGKNPGDVWHIEKAKFSGEHFATFPERLVERPLLATCPAKVCLSCGVPWKTRTTKQYVGQPVRFKRDRYVRRHPVRYRVIRRNPQLRPGCDCRAATRPGVVLDPFFGTGTVGRVAEQHGRDWVGIELNPRYCDLAWQRVRSLPIRRRAAR
jgi:site-specific DNA-methyltransferase (adenine-specific)